MSEAQPEIDFTTYDDQTLENLRVAVIVEAERRQRQAQVPAQVADLVRRYTDDGGDPQAITSAVEEALAPEPAFEQPVEESGDEPAPESEPQA